MRYLLACFVITALLFSTANAADFTLTSPDVQNGERLSIKQVFNGFGCTGDNVSPSLEWKNVPAETKSFAVTLYDPDAPTGSGWWHWVVFNIPASIQSLPANFGTDQSPLLPATTIQSRTDFGTKGFGGACPPQGDKPHRYQFTVYALDVDRLDLPSGAPAAMVGFYLHQHTIAKAQIIATYSR
ncbi:YbhB/YbcL family Raf kinase inhibitor-like protein [Halodesulfovibrio sp. MK-HDV]|uniref:YbhB/YbcL family Raf kinase inhibitor-like protein n=1 Tax=unclassified Halodesulfovibrio TaxID=2644657 RepID=UPI0013709939|nr:YbhB/YbcL family Raf kinase inhibitor-like protein [Halodesulfovibrio sp. MK-HDV]KAF1076625.1 hypothetical protein MKHDV_01193 [Halodesulfovibrio sp. MK-HDV]